MVAPHEREVHIILKLVRDVSITSESKGVSEVIKKVQSEASKATKETTAATTKAVQETSRVTEQAAKQTVNHQRIMLGHMASMGTHFSRLTSSAARLARGIGLVFISGEKDRQKFMESLVKIIGFTDILAGGVNTVANMTRMWLAYSRAVHGAAVSHTALAAAQSGGLGLTAVGVGNVARYSRPTVATSLSGGVKRFNYVPLGATAGAAGGGVGAGLAGSVGTFTVAIIGAVGALSSLETVARKLEGKKGPGLITEKTGGLLRWIRKTGMEFSSSQALREVIERNPNDFAAAVAREVLSERGLTGLERKGQIAAIETRYQGTMVDLRARQARERMRESGTVAGIQAEVAKANLQGESAYVAVLKQAEGMYQERLATSKAVTAETQKQVAALRQQYGITARIAGLGQTAIERWVGMDPRERGRFLRAKRKLERGERLGRRDFDALQGMRGVGTAIDPKVTEAYAEEAKRLPGTVEALGADYLSRFAIARAGERILKLQIEGTNETVTIRVRDEAEMDKQLKAFARKIVEDIRRERNRDIENAMNEANTERAADMRSLLGPGI